MSSPRVDFSRKTFRWLWPAAVLALTPKCLMCVLAYAGLGAALGFSGPELCGSTPASLETSAWSLAWFALVGAIGLFLAFFMTGRRPCSASVPKSNRG